MNLAESQRVSLLDDLIELDEVELHTMLRERDVVVIRKQLHEWATGVPGRTFSPDKAKEILRVFQRLHPGGA
jgi:hypothetical protein